MLGTFMFLASPRDQRIAKEDVVASSGLTTNKVTNPISISINMNTKIVYPWHSIAYEELQQNEMILEQP